jgi:PBP1b-binding outer membrane lipoprotein LpoB
MSKSFFTVLTLALFLLACGSDPKEDPQYQQHVDDARRAEAQVAQRDSTINDLFGTLNRISENLRTIRAKQGQLVTPTSGMEKGSDIGERIMSDIESIDALLAENRKLMDRLRSNANLSVAGLTELQRTISDLERSMAEKDQEIATMKEELASSNATLSTLISMYHDKEQLADMQREELNTAYYAVGTVRELRANGVLSKEGGVAGIGGVNKLDMARLPKSYFRKIDVLANQEIPVVAKKASLVTPHPEGSYRFENGAEKLVITDAQLFWSISRYLVVVVE